jgi:hypothetical protein
MNTTQLHESVFLNLYNDEEFKKTQQILYYENATKTAVIVDPRFNILMESVIRNFMYFLTPREWNLCIISYSGYESQIKSIFPNCIFKAIDEKYIFFKDDIPNISIASYNEFFKNIHFWKELPGEHFLIFQTDCIMYKMFDEMFLEYDYCGAAFYSEASFFYKGINGGCSLRKKNAMIECIEKIDIKKIMDYKLNMSNTLLKYNDNLYVNLFKNLHISQSPNEDVFFTHACEMLQKSVPEVIHRSQFAIETDFNINTSIHHGWDKAYQTYTNATRLLENSVFFNKYFAPLDLTPLSSSINKSATPLLEQNSSGDILPSKELIISHKYSKSEISNMQICDNIAD